VVFHPFQQFALEESPDPALAFAERMRRHIAATRPADQGAAIHFQDSRGFLGVIKEDAVSPQCQKTSLIDPCCKFAAQTYDCDDKSVLG